MRIHLGLLSLLRGAASDVDERMEQGKIYLRDGRIDEAAKEFRTLLAKSPIDDKAALWLTRALLIEGNYLEAQKTLFRALAWHSKSIPLREQLAGLLHTTGSYWDAETEYKKLSNEGPSDQFTVYLGLASLKYRDARYDDAFEYYQRALNIDPQNIGALLGVIGCAQHVQAAKNFIEQLQEKNLKDHIVSSALKNNPTARLKPAPANSKNAEDIAVLFIDHFLPCKGGSAGSTHHFEIIKLLRESGVQVTVIARNGEYQTEGKQQLEAIGVETFATDPERLLAWNYNSTAERIDFDELFKKRRYVLAILARHNIGAVYMNVLKKHLPELAIAILTADLQFMREEKKQALYGSDPLVSEIRAAELQSYDLADCLIAVSDPDEEILRKHFPSKEIFTIPLIYEINTSPVEFGFRKDLLFVGNFVHPPNADGVVHYSGHILPSLRNRLPGVKTYVVGAHSIPLLQSFACDDLIITGYVPSIEPFLAACKINIAPLRYGSGMNGKVVESMAAGLPVITTPAVAEAIGNDSGLIVAEDDEEFAEKIIQLYQSEELWRTARDQACNTIKNKFSPEVIKKRIDELLGWASHQLTKQRSNL
ncbi:MAG TPA: glycosyltransferase [Acidobacteriota bacterium]|nr:glycosyltransferase [Acidobacteriota bacterium]